MIKCFCCGDDIELNEQTGIAVDENDNRDIICETCNILLDKHVALVVENFGKRSGEVFFVPPVKLHKVFHYFPEGFKIYTLPSEGMRIVVKTLILESVNKN